MIKELTGFEALAFAKAHDTKVKVAFNSMSEDIRAEDHTIEDALQIVDGDFDRIFVVTYTPLPKNANKCCPVCDKPISDGLEPIPSPYEGGDDVYVCSDLCHTLITLTATFMANDTSAKVKFKGHLAVQHKKDNPKIEINLPATPFDPEMRNVSLQDAELHEINYPGTVWCEADIPKPKAPIIGNSGNAFVILGICHRAARRAKWPQDLIETFMREAKSSTYENLLSVVQDYFIPCAAL